MAWLTKSFSPPLSRLRHDAGPAAVRGAPAPLQGGFGARQPFVIGLYGGRTAVEAGLPRQRAVFRSSWDS